MASEKNSHQICIWEPATTRFLSPCHPVRNGFQPRLKPVFPPGDVKGRPRLDLSLNIPGVSRETSRDIPLYDDSKDAFFLSSEDLARVHDGDPPPEEFLFPEFAYTRFDPGNRDFFSLQGKDLPPNIWRCDHA
jgi:Salmonella virulence plasmid 65kDa B protein